MSSTIVGMSVAQSLRRQVHVHRIFAVQFLSLLVAAHAIFILAETLLEQLAVHRGSSPLSDIVVDIPLLIGLGLLYLATLLRRRKRKAWQVTLLAYVFYLGLTVSQVVMRAAIHDVDGLEIIRSIVLPTVVIALLLLFQQEFTVKSDQQGFRWALRFVALVLLATFAYGVSGFMLLDKSDFHQEIRLATAAHYTVDQFDLTTNHPLHPATKRAHLFVDSLSFVSVAAVSYAAISFFQPLRSRLSDQTKNRERMLQLLRQYGAPSEDFFKLWPHDKQYFFDTSGRAGLAFHVYRGVALCLADPAGDPRHFKRLVQDFSELCFNNDWLPGLVHIEARHRKLYESQGFELQKLGEEAVLQLASFQADVRPGKYFRQINNKFSKQSYSVEVVEPPHHAALIKRLHEISDQWLDRGAHVERRFVMGYFSESYLQQCKLVLVRDAAGTIQAFANLVPADFDSQEATFDMLRHATGSLSNINDYLLMQLIDYLVEHGYTRLNLGLCPLVGLDATTSEAGGVVDGFLRFAYANGDRFYSFSGLQRFKAKYQPEWRDRYIGYQRGIRGFSRTMNALMRTMRVKT